MHRVRDIIEAWTYLTVLYARHFTGSTATCPTFIVGLRCFTTGDFEHCCLRGWMTFWLSNFRPGAENTLPTGGKERPSANYMHFRGDDLSRAVTIYPTDFVQLLWAGRQAEQVWQTGTLCPLGLDFQDRPTQESLLQPLYPEREHPGRLHSCGTTLNSTDNFPTVV